MNNIPEDFPEIDWNTPADPHEIAQLREHAKWPLWEKLAWLESAQLMAESLEKSRLKQAQLKREKHDN